jgi:hypothetical protein
VARTRERRGTCRVLIGKPNGKIPTGRPRRRWEDNIKGTSRNGIRRYGLYLSGSEEEEVTYARECSNEPSGSNKMQGGGVFN